MKREAYSMTDAELMAKLSKAILSAEMTEYDAADLTGIDRDRLESCLKCEAEISPAEYLSLCRLLKLDPYYAE